MSDQLLYALAVVVALMLVYYIWFRPEYLTDDEIAQSLIANAMISDPIDSTAVIRAMPPGQRKRYEHLVGLPYNPNYYKEHMVGLPYNPNYYQERLSSEPKYYSEHMGNDFIMALNA